MRNYEVTFIVDPTLSNDEIKSTAKKYVDQVSGAGKIVHNNAIGLRQLAYPIRNRNTGIYTCVEFEVPNGAVIDELELAMRRDERILRFLSVRLDKYGVKYNEDKRAGKIGTIVRKKKVVEEDRRDNRRRNNKRRPNNKGGNKPQAKPATENTAGK
ncbi:MAG: 30S ribosomal protein S6 [Saprospiraceae bacterium]